MQQHTITEEGYDGSGGRLGKLDDSNLVMDYTWEVVVSFDFAKFQPCEQYVFDSIY